MNIAVTGSQERIQELRARLSSGCNIQEFDFSSHLPECDLLIDLNFDEQPERLSWYVKAGVPLLLCSIRIQLAAVVSPLDNKPKAPVYGLNALPTFLNKDIWEVSSYSGGDQGWLDKQAVTLGIKTRWVQDRVGLVSPRILFMIINEAFYTVQEGTATREDIDTAMKLGTAYPFGPFEFTKRIGIRNVYETLKALQDDTAEERYRICPMLKTEYLLS